MCKLAIRNAKVSPENFLNPNVATAYDDPYKRHNKKNARKGPMSIEKI